MGCNRGDVVRLFSGLPIPATKDELCGRSDLANRIFQAACTSGGIIKDGDKYRPAEDRVNEEISRLEEELAPKQKWLAQLLEHRASMATQS